MDGALRRFEERARETDIDVFCLRYFGKVRVRVPRGRAAPASAPPHPRPRRRFPPAPGPSALPAPLRGGSQIGPVAALLCSRMSSLPRSDRACVRACMARCAFARAWCARAGALSLARAPQMRRGSAEAKAQGLGERRRVRRRPGHGAEPETAACI